MPHSEQRHLSVASGEYHGREEWRRVEKRREEKRSEETRSDAPQRCLR